MSFSWTLFDSTVCFYECGIIMLLLVRKLGFPPKKLRFVLLGYLGIACTDALLRWSGMNPIPVLFILIAETAAYSFFIFEGKLSRRIIWGIISCGLGQFCINVAIGIFAVSGNMNMDDFLIPSQLRFTVLIGYLMVLTLMYFVLVNIRPKRAEHLNAPFRIAMLGIFVFGLLTTMQISSQYVYHDTSYPEGIVAVSNNLINITVVLIAIFMSMLCLFEYTGMLWAPLWGFLFFVASVVFTVWALVMRTRGYYFTGTPLPMMAVISFMTGVICVLMGLLAEMITRTFHESQNKSIYLVKKTRNFPLS
ncbi:MAG: hypothetical protein WCP73_07975 [Eubacteriales bacterium]